MSYRLERTEALAPGLKRIAVEQIDDALAQLREPGDDLDEAIHEARKCFKKVRAVVRLVRDELGHTIYKRENVCFRDAGRALSDLRDSYVMVATVDDLQETYADQLDDEAFTAIRQPLVEKHQEVRQQVIESETLDDVITTISAARQRVQDLPIDDDDYEAIRPSIKRVYRRGYKGRRRAYDEPSAEKFHEWRKRVKYLWYHTRILNPLWPDLLDPLAEEIHDLSDYLGDDHDLAELREVVRELPATGDRQDERQVLLGLIEQRRREFQELARPLAARLYAESPSRFVDRLGSYWQAHQIEIA
ncbi:MAG: CHAD domain-containing protein [Candidatus Promineifilaceae bacterium]|nr:CHAD domain-containing protein [Candidatus Promineifilaceae bacterium]